MSLNGTRAVVTRRFVKVAHGTLPHHAPPLALPRAGPNLASPPFAQLCRQGDGQPPYRAPHEKDQPQAKVDGLGEACTSLLNLGRPHANPGTPTHPLPNPLPTPFRLQWLPETAAYIVEESIVNPKTQLLKTRTRNVTLKTYLYVEAIAEFRPHLAAGAGAGAPSSSSEETQLRTRAMVKSELSIGRMVEAFGLKRFYKNDDRVRGCPARRDAGPLGLCLSCPRAPLTSPVRSHPTLRVLHRRQRASAGRSRTAAVRRPTCLPPRATSSGSTCSCKNRSRPLERRPLQRNRDGVPSAWPAPGCAWGRRVY